MVRDEKVDFGGGAFALLGVLKHRKPWLIGRL